MSILCRFRKPISFSCSLNGKLYTYMDWAPNKHWSWIWGVLRHSMSQGPLVAHLVWFLLKERISAPEVWSYLEALPSQIMYSSLTSISGGSLSPWQPPLVSGASSLPSLPYLHSISLLEIQTRPTLSMHRAAFMPSPLCRHPRNSALSRHIYLTSMVSLDYSEVESFLCQKFSSDGIAAVRR